MYKVVDLPKVNTLLFKLYIIVIQRNNEILNFNLAWFSLNEDNLIKAL